MKSQPVTISVIIPVYNDELYLKDALLSIQQQTFTDFECICINDGSTDKSEEIIDEFIKNDSRFSKINKTNGGVSSARNAGLDAAKGEYVFMMDHDDLIPVYTLKKLLEVAQKNDADMSRGRMMMIAEDFKLNNLPLSKDPEKQKYFDDPLTDFYKHIRGKYKSWCYIWQCLFKRAAIQDLRFVESLRAGGEDNLFMFEAVNKIKNFVQIEDIVACHRFSKISITLNGFNMYLINMFDTIIPYIYTKYAMDKSVDKRLLWWVYRKESYAVYRILVRNTIRINDIKYQSKSRDLFLKFVGTPELKEVMKRWTFRQKIFFHLFMNEQYSVLRKLKIFM
jgi:glycosyltransferase involved in cell wall biosynthesis